LIFALFLASILQIVTVAQATIPRYAIVIDAGSTGTRAFVFQEHNFDEDDRVIQSIPCGKERMGLSSFAGNHSAVTSLFSTLLSNAAAIIPPMYHRSTSLYVRGTAGMRLMEKRSHDALWAAVVRQLRRDPSVPFHIDRRNFGTISGHEEAFYAVLASNYIAGSIDGNLRYGLLHCLL
jgi:Golgi nucleoside diphosphatase